MDQRVFNDGAEPLQVPFLGEFIECATAQDGEDVRRAAWLLNNGNTSTPEELHRLAGVLAQYGRHQAAATLRNLERSLHAALYLRNALDGERPTTTDGEYSAR